MTGAAGEPPADRPDLRAVLLALVAWAGALAGFLLPAPVVVAALVLVTGFLAVRRRRGRPVVVLSACLVAGAAVCCSAMLRAEANRHNPVADLAAERAFVSLTVAVTSDPLLREGEYGPFVLVRGRVTEVTGRGRISGTRVPVLVIAGPTWRRVQLGATVRAEGRLGPPDGSELAAVLSTGREPEVLKPPGDAFGAAATVRASIREAVAGLPREQRSLIPALVVGDDQGLPAEVVESFQTSGLTHLLAVSGTNLTLVVGFLLVVARWAGVRARGLVVVGAVGVLGFVLLARTEPSVVRAAAMGTVALLGMGSNGREKGVRALGAAVLVLLLVDPWMALSLGFVLSALATAGILFLAPPWRDAMMRWLPRWVAEGVAVPLAAQLACTPVVAAISGQVSLVAVAANMVVAPAVGPATVCGLVAGLAAMVAAPVGELVGRVAGWCAGWIVAVAHHSAALPTAAVDWDADVGSIGSLTGLCVLVALGMPALLARRAPALAGSLVLLLLVLRPLPSPGWPPDGWVLVACDVGQGDGIVLNAGSGQGAVVDVGPAPEAMDGCLDRLQIESVPLLVLTHFHADHVAGLTGVLQERRPQQILVSGLPVPQDGAAAVSAAAEAAGVPVRPAGYGETGAVGTVTWQVVGPAREVDGAARYGEEGSAANNASVVLLVDVRGVRILLTGDMEPEAQQLMGRTLRDLEVDVLKVPHHGSRYQDSGFLSGLGARLAVISAGEDNDYGHPAPETLDLLREAGMLVRRTDRSGDVAVLLRDGRLSVRAAGR